MTSSIRGRFLLPGGAERSVVLALILVAFVLRLFRLDMQGIWADEGSSIYWASQGWGAISSLAEADVHPPLYYALLHFWILLAGTGEFASRFLSLVFGLLALPVLFQLGKPLIGRSGAALAVLVASLAPFLVYYSQETRMYTLGLFFSLLSVTACLRWLQDRGSLAWLGCYVVAAAASVYTHHYAWLIVGFLNLFVLTWTWASGRQALGRLTHWAVAQVALVLIYLPWMGVVLNKYEKFVPAAPPTDLGAILYQTLVSFGLGYWAGQAGATPGQADLFPDHWVVFSLALALLALAGWGLLSGSLPSGRREASPYRAFIPLYLVLPLVLITVLSWNKVDFTPRYLFFAAPAYYLLLGRGMASLISARKAWGIVALLLVLGASTLSLRNYFFDPTYWRDDIRGVAQFLDSRWREGDAIILNAYYLKPTFAYYYQGDAPVLGLPAQLPTEWDEELPTLQETTRQHQRVWLVLWQDYYTDPQGRIQKWLEKDGIRFQHKGFRGDINILGYLTRPPHIEGTPPGQPVGLQLGSIMELTGYQLTDGPLCAGEEVGFTLFWRALHPTPSNYTVFVHLVDAQGKTLAQADSQPANGGYPTTLWPVGSQVADEHWIGLPPDLPPGQYFMEVGMYDTATMKRLGADGTGPSQYRLGPLQVLPDLNGRPPSFGRRTGAC